MIKRNCYDFLVDMLLMSFRWVKHAAYFFMLNMFKLQFSRTKVKNNFHLMLEKFFFISQIDFLFSPLPKPSILHFHVVLQLHVNPTVCLPADHNQKNVEKRKFYESIKARTAMPKKKERRKRNGNIWCFVVHNFRLIHSLPHLFPV